MVDRVNVGSDTDPTAAGKQAAHDAAMAAKAEAGVSSISSVNKQTGDEVNLGVTPTEGQVAQRPDDVPEKFWDAEKGEINVAALLKAQQDAEKALRQKQTGEQKPEETATPEGAPKVEAGQQNAVDAAAKEWADTGALTDDTFKSLESVGLSRDMVESYIAGQQAIVGQLQGAAYGEFGGKQESYLEATKWAAANLSDDEIQALDVQLTSTNPAIVKQGAQALAARYKAEADITPETTLQGDGNATNTGSYFKSSHEMTMAMRDARYAKDESYRKEVEQKIDRAIKAGVKLYG